MRVTTLTDTLYAQFRLSQCGSPKSDISPAKNGAVVMIALLSASRVATARIVNFDG
jgi:hypothetical protein